MTGIVPRTLVLTAIALGPTRAAVEPDAAARLAPSSRSPVLDGTVDADEWASSHVIRMRDDCLLRFMLCADALYFSVSGPKDVDAIVTVAFAYRELIQVNHASYSLGAAQYQRPESGSGAWSRLRPFNWDASTGIEEPQGSKARQAHLERHSWTATPIEVGRRGDFEFIMPRPLLRWTHAVPDAEGGGLEFRFAVSVLDLESGRIAATYPTDLRDGTVNEALQRGDAPEALVFDPARWGRVRWMRSE